MASEHRTARWSLYCAVFLDMFGGMTVQPLLPFVALSFHADAFQLGLLAALFSGSQSVGALTLGTLSDKLGRRRVLLVCLCTTGLTLVLFGLAQNFTQLLIFRSLDGFFSGTIGIAQAFLADLVAPEDRASAMAHCGSMLGLGLIAGPGIGGLLFPQVGFFGVAFFAAALTFTNFAVGMWTLPKSVVVVEGETAVSDPAIANGEEEAPPKRTFLQSSRTMVMILLVNFLYMTGMGIFVGTNALFLHQRFGISAAGFGGILMTAGATYVILQAFCVGRVTALLRGEGRTMLLGLAARICGFGCMITPLLLPDGHQQEDSNSAVTLAAIFTIMQPWLATILVVAGNAFFMPCVATLVANEAAPSDRGKFLGLLQSLSAGGNFVGPLLGGALYATDTTLPYKAAALFDCVGAMVVFLTVISPGTCFKGAAHSSALQTAAAAPLLPSEPP